MTDRWGLVLPPTMVIDDPEGENAVLRTGGPLTDHELRSDLLLWDELNYPFVRNTSIGVTADQWFLIAAGVMRRLEVDVESGPLSKMLHEGHLKALQTLDVLEPGKWSLGTGKNALPLDTSALEKRRGILLCLHEAVPVPDKEVPLHDILEFRRKYRDELLMLRFHLYSIYDQILRSGDVDLALNTERSSLDRAIVAYIRAAKSSRMRCVNSSLTAELNVPSAMAAGLSAMAVGLTAVQSLLSAAAVGVSVNTTLGLKGRKPQPTPFRYISRFHSRLF